MDRNWLERREKMECLQGEKSLIKQRIEKQYGMLKNTSVCKNIIIGTVNEKP